MQKIFFFILIVLGCAALPSWAAPTEPTTDPKGKEGKKDSASAKSDVELKGFRNLFTSDVFNPAEPYALQINPKAVPYIDDYIVKHRAHLEGMKVWGKPYFRMMDNILASYGIPRELKYLAVIESNLQNAALSWAGARGPWQFMPETARQLGLVVNSTRDDRTDYYKSTHAAARYLKILYDQLGGDWLLVIAGYNGGPGKVLNAIKRTGSRDFWVLQNALPLESRNHVKKFIATHYVMEGTGGVTTVTSGELAQLHARAVEENAERITRTFSDNAKLRANLPAEAIEGTTVQKIQGKYNSVVLCTQLSLDIAQFNKLNPSFDKLVQEEEGYEIRLPEDKMQQFNTIRYQILQQSIMASLQSVTAAPEGFPDPNKKPAATTTPVRKRK
jgi:membrane-bound lytic murein transglycosylase D